MRIFNANISVGVSESNIPDIGFILGKMGRDGKTGVMVGDGITGVVKILGMVDANLEHRTKKRFMILIMMISLFFCRCYLLFV